jgi:alpha-tubulin suppressor-like RCC1 family protein
MSAEGEAPPLHGEDAVEIEGVSNDEYGNLAKKRVDDRKTREIAEDTKKDDCKPSFIQPHKEKRFKIYMKYEGRKGPPAWLKARLPKHGGFEDGSAMGIKKMFCQFYNRMREMLSIHSIHLRSETGIAIPDEDALSGYIGYGGLVYVVDGSAPGKPAEMVPYFWGANCWSDPKGDTPSAILTLQRKRICQISVGKEHCMALSEGGRCFAWGKNDFGQLGTGDEEDRALPVYTELPYETYIAQVACGGNYTLALEKRGSLWSWGRFQASNFPRLFTETWCNGYEAKGENGLKGLKLAKVSAGDQHMGVLTKDNKLYTWGYNDYGQLGWGLHGEGRVGQQKPNQVQGMLAGEEVIDFACGGGHTAAITKSARVFGWGSNTNGQLGHAMRNCFPEPVEIPLGDPVAKVRAGWQCTVYITESARPIVCGGIRAEGPSVADMQKQAGGEDGDGPAPEMQKGGGPQAEATVMDMVDNTGMEVMTEVVTEASVGEAHGLLVCYDGSIRGWGYNRQAQAIGDFSDETFVKPQYVDDLPEGFKGHSVAAAGAQSYALMKPPGVY